MKEDEDDEQNPEEDPEADRPQEFKFCYLVKMQLRIDKNTEIHKEILNSNSLFRLSEAFRMFDQDNKGYITEADLREKFNEKKIYADPSVIIQRFDRDGDGNLSFQEFKQIVTP